MLLSLVLIKKLVTEKVQHKALIIIGPLSRVRSTLEEKITFEENQQKISLEEMVQCVQCSVICASG